MGKHGSQVDILFYFNALNDNFAHLVDIVAVCEAKSSENIHTAYETALNQLYKREYELKNTLDPSTQFLPIVFLKGERNAVNDPTDYLLQEIHKRARKVWENDIDFYVSQAITLGWKKTWNLFLLEVLGLRTGTEEKISLPSIRYQIKGKTAYSVFLPVTDALKICHVERARKKAPHGVYQRPLVVSRLKVIAEDLKNPNSLNTCFPNSIVAAFDPLISSKLQEPLWQPISKDTGNNPSQIGTLILPIVYGLLKIIDGQHRVFAHDLLPQETISKYGLPFTIMDDLRPQEEMVLFKSINTTAEEVNANLVDIILYTMKDYETDRGIASSVICSLAFEDEDWIKFFDHLGTGIPNFDQYKSGTKIKIDNLVQPLIREGDYGLIRDNGKGYLNPESEVDKVTYAKDVLKKYYALLKEKFKRDDYRFWKNYIRTRPGLRLSLLLLSNWIWKKNFRGNSIPDLKLDDLVNKIYKGRNAIKTEFDITKGSSRGDELLKKIVNKIL
jgi:DGQHR domain-containing protein